VVGAPKKPAGALVYLVIGEGHHLPEAVFSVSSARWHEPRIGARSQVILYTDSRRVLPHELEIEQRVIPAERLASWTRGSPYRAKVCALRDALDTSGAACVLLDSDTYFRRPPQALYARCGAGKSVLHMKERRMDGMRGATAEHPQGAWGRFIGMTYRDSRGRPGLVEAGDFMWNAGVVAVPRESAHLIDDVLAVHDSLLEQGLPPISEQVALSQVLAKRADLVAAADVVFHYWGRFRQPWQAALASLLEQAERLPVDQRAGFLYANRPRLSAAQQLRHLVKIPLQRLGFVEPAEASSHHSLPPALPRKPGSVRRR